MSASPSSLKLLTSGSRNVFNPIRSFYWPSSRFVQKICLVFINTPPKELMDGHVILTGPSGRHGLRSSESRGCWSREGAFWMGAAPAFHRNRRSTSGASIVALPSEAGGCIAVVISSGRCCDPVRRIVIVMRITSPWYLATLNTPLNHPATAVSQQL